MHARNAAGILVLMLGVSLASAEEFKLPKADAEKWAKRIRGLARDGWTVTIKDNDIILQRDKPVRFARIQVNAPFAPGEKERTPDLREGRFRLMFRFAPRMSMDEYEKLAAENAASDAEHDRLKRALGLPHKFEDFIASTPEEKRRLKDYREAVARLKRHTLPDLYSTDYSIFLVYGHNDWSYVYDKDVAAECQDVEETLLRYFGMYSPRAAARGTRAGRHEPTGR
jgi:hypothetical protein